MNRCGMSLCTSSEQRWGWARAEEESEEDEETAASVEQAVSAAMSELPPAWLDVTTAVRFMVSDSNLQFHKVSSSLYSHNI